mmetsp:Transcript_18917/g.25644  ORF Transcript_18917/g.25644 Transcript_18917/m.25644 type:complete len:321 (-) Transcript_18917:1036-1998(-)
MSSDVAVVLLVLSCFFFSALVSSFCFVSMSLTNLVVENLGSAAAFLSATRPASSAFFRFDLASFSFLDTSLRSSFCFDSFLLSSLRTFSSAFTALSRALPSFFAFSFEAFAAAFCCFAAVAASAFFFSTVFFSCAAFASFACKSAFFFFSDSALAFALASFAAFSFAACFFFCSAACCDASAAFLFFAASTCFSFSFLSWAAFSFTICAFALAVSSATTFSAAFFVMDASVASLLSAVFNFVTCVSSLARSAFALSRPSFAGSTSFPAADNFASAAAFAAPLILISFDCVARSRSVLVAFTAANALTLSVVTLPKTAAFC